MRTVAIHIEALCLLFLIMIDSFETLTDHFHEPAGMYQPLFASAPQVFRVFPWNLGLNVNALFILETSGNTVYSVVEIFPAAFVS